MIGEAVHEMRGDGAAERAEVRVELPVDAHIPHDYVPGERLRLEAYTAIAAIDSEADLKSVLDELTDRFGAPPMAVLNLLQVARLRFKARKAGLTDITQQGNHIRFAPVELPESREVRVQRLYPRTLLKPAVRTMLVPVPKVGSRPSSRAVRRGPPEHQRGLGVPARRAAVARRRTAGLVRGAGRYSVRRRPCGCAGLRLLACEGELQCGGSCPGGRPWPRLAWLERWSVSGCVPTWHIGSARSTDM